MFVIVMSFSWSGMFTKDQLIEIMPIIFVTALWVYLIVNMSTNEFDGLMTSYVHFTIFPAACIVATFMLYVCASIILWNKNILCTYFFVTKFF